MKPPEKDKSDAMSLSLGNNYTPSHNPAITTRILARLPADELTNLCLLWLTIASTRPNPPKKMLSDLGFETRNEFISDWKDWLTRFKASKTKNKRKIIDRILSEQYSRGLNLLQLAQIDSQLLVSRSNSFQWKVSELLTPEGSSLVASVPQPQKFLENILNTLASLFLTHIYIARHPHYPLIIIRIQLFDHVHVTSNNSLAPEDSIISRKPMFIGLPMNSSKLLITPGPPSTSSDTSYDLIIHALERALSDSMNREVRTVPTSNAIVRSLDSAFVLAGNSRFTGSLGAWSVYASGGIDISPFDDAKMHATFQNMEKCDADEVKKRISMLRFKGGVKKSGVKLYEGGRKKRKKETMEDGDWKEYYGYENEFRDEEQDIDDESNEYASLVPVQNIEFELTSEFKGFKPSIKLKFQGNDVFGGLHELCDKELADPELIPGWLTGESVMGGKVEDGVFIEQEPPSRGLMSGSLI